MIEIAAAISVASSAFGAIKSAIETGKDIEDMYGTFASFFDAKEQLAEAQVLASNPSMMGKLFSGRSVEAEALEITAARHKIKQLEKELYEYLLYTGQTQFYEDMMRERRIIRQRRLEAAERAARKKANIIDGIAIAGFLIFVGMLIGFFVSIV